MTSVGWMRKDQTEQKGNEGREDQKGETQRKSVYNAERGKDITYKLFMC